MTAYENMPPDSRVWIYQADRELNADEAGSITKEAEAFSEEWTAHNHQLKASFKLFYNRFLVFLVDESHEMPSGCSIDKSVNLVKQLETKYNVSLLNRMNFAYKQNDKVLACSRQEFESRMASGDITDSTPVFNNLVSTKAEFESGWEIPLEKSWHKSVLS